MRVALAALVLAAAVAPAVAQETGFAVRDTEVKKEPYSDAQTVGTVPEKAQVKVLARQGGWMQVESGATSGWVRMLSIRMNSGQSSFASGLKSLFSVARTGSSGQTVTTGVRGLDKEQIQNAKPNPEELKKLGAFAASQGDAERFAAGNPQLRNQKIDYLAPQ
ncbi:MAG TPA: SH3 domain-containing protein [Burkholderiales bacterium]|nr:SH3 domain-containing protein [Burkholderiales bacterium]